jgi:hypothetical protein
MLAAATIVLVWSSGARSEIREAAGIVHVATEGPADSVTVGQRFPVVYTLSAPDSLTPVVPENIEAGNCRVVSLSWRETRAEGMVERTASALMVPVALDSVAVPPVAFDFVAPDGDTLRAWSEGFEVPIRRIALVSEDIRPLKSQWEVPPDYVRWALIALGAMALAALIVWWARRRRARVVAVAPEIRLPPDVTALAGLEKIESMGLVERGEFKSYYTMVADVLRRYLGARFDVESMDRTTYELLDELERGHHHVDGLASFLSDADLVKFAKFRPDAPSAQRLIESARAIVVATTPRVTPPAHAATGTES